MGLVEVFASDFDRAFRLVIEQCSICSYIVPSSVNSCNWREQLFSGYSPKDKGENEKRAKNY
jgi:hypothetical protein